MKNIEDGINTRMPSKKCPTRMPNKNAQQECPTRMPNKNAQQECPTRMRKNNV
jgi:hypothetical protein